MISKRTPKNIEDMTYISTRGDMDEVNSATAIIRGPAPDKGLYVPSFIPKFSFNIEELCGAHYSDIAQKVMNSFFTDFTFEELRKCVDGAYDDKFDTPYIAPVSHTRKAEFLELYHGRTAAFKDMALSILPFLLTYSLRKERVDKKIAILTATSGDTGKAALEGFADVMGTEIIVFYPKDGVSEIQERQMVTQRGSNTHVFALHGNFDDAQRGVKEMFADLDFIERLNEEGYLLSSANSISIGRLIPQIAYYVSAYVRLIENGRLNDGDTVNIVVPTGNFGNILAAWYAYKMGLPVGRLICASNENNILTDLINTGVYDMNRKFVVTSSPSMDILVSSNLERLLWHLSGENSEEVCGYMDSLASTGKYKLKAATKDAMSDILYGGYANMDSAHETIARLWTDEHYLVDTHTAVGYSVYLKYREETGDDTKTIIASTASPYKFADTVAESLGVSHRKDGFAYIEALHDWTDVPIPQGLKYLESKPILFNTTVDYSDMRNAVLSALD